jgi:hypothetical protein
MTARMDALTLELVHLVREYERNCRCPRCHEQAFRCTECPFCQANLQKLFLRELTANGQKPAAGFSSCQANADHPTIALMKTTKPRKTKAHKTTPKAKAKLKPKLKLKTKKRTPPKRTPKPQAISEPKKRTRKPSGGDDPYAKRIFVRFDTPELKELARTAATAVPMSLSAYIAATAVKLAREGWKPELRPQAVEKAEAAKAS